MRGGSRPIRRSLAAVVMAGVLLGGSAAGSAQDSGEMTDAEIVERILVLQEEIEALMRQLSPAGLEQLQRRLSGLPDSAPASPAGVVEAEAAEAAAPTPPTPAEPPTAIAERSVAPAPAKPASAAAACDTLRAFDSNEDGKVSSADRYWRYFYLWTDSDGDGQAARGEIKSAFDHGVRGISVRLDMFELTKGQSGLIRLRGGILLDLEGNGFGDADDAILALDTTSLARGTGPQILSSAGEPVTGLQPLAPGWTLRDASGTVEPLLCPKP